MLPPLSQLTQVPITRFRRELRKWLRRNDVVAVTRKRQIVCVAMPYDLYQSAMTELDTMDQQRIKME